MAHKNRRYATTSSPLNRKERRFARLMLALLEDRTVPSTISVVNTYDSGAGSLRQAILDANADPSIDTIAFNIPGSGVHTIRPQSPFDPLVNPVTINGYSQPGAACNTLPNGDNALLLIEISGDQAGDTAIGFTIYGGHSTVQGLVINGFDGNGIQLSGGDYNTVRGCFIGTDPTGMNAMGNGAAHGGPVPYNSVNAGIQVTSSHNMIGGLTPADRNVISGNRGNGVTINGSNGPSEDDFAGAFHNQVAGNFIGTDQTGLQALGNAIDGVSVMGMRTTVAQPTRPVPDTIIGGATVGARNIIAANGDINNELGAGIRANIADGTWIQGNFVGTDVTGTLKLGSYIGVQISASHVKIGGLTATPGTGEGNLIAGNWLANVNVFVSNDIKVQGNLIGTDATGTHSIANNYRTAEGVNISGSTNVVVGGTDAGTRNVISGNESGVYIANGNQMPSINDTIQDNYFGTDITGNDFLRNSDHTIELSEEGVTVVGGHSITIGGTTDAARNVIATARSVGVRLVGDCHNNTIQGNYIGLGADGTTALHEMNDQECYGILVGEDGPAVGDVHDIMIGGTAVGARNVITSGITITSGAFAVSVQGNYIGTDAAGHGALGAGRNTGVVMLNGAHDNAIGGSAPGAGNLISGNHNPSGYNIQALWIDETSFGNRVQGNLIGPDIDHHPLGNHGGIVIYGSNNIIGGTGPGEGNEIAYSGIQFSDLTHPEYPGAVGVVVRYGGTGNVIRGNSIHDNAGLGIDLEGDGVTFNDVGDGDNESNNLQNFPVIASVSISGGTTQAAGTLSSSANATFSLDFYANSTGDGSGYGEGERYLGSTTVTTNGSGIASFSVTLGAMLPTEVLTSTATDQTGNTSEFSQWVAPQVNPTPSYIQGLVYVDFNNDGQADFGEHAIAGVTVTLTGIDDLGNAVNRTMQTDANGNYTFANLRPSNAAGYTITESQPTGYPDGRDTRGTVNGVAIGTAGNDVFTGIVISQGGSLAQGYNFGERAALAASSAYILNLTASGAVTASGNAVINLTNGLFVDSSSASAVLASGNARVNVGYGVYVQGGVSHSGNALVTKTGSPSFTIDPLAGLSLPSLTGLTNFGAVSVGGNSTRTLNPGIYTSIQISGNAVVTMNPGIYVIKGGGFMVSGNGSVTGNGVFIFNAGSNFNGSTDGGTFGAVSIGGNGNVSLSAATTGDYATVLIYQSVANTKALLLSGNGLAGITGVVYVPSAMVGLSGNGQFHGTLVANTFNVSGNAGAFQIVNGAVSNYIASNANLVVNGILTLAAEDDTGSSIDPAMMARLDDAMVYLNDALSCFGVTLTWAGSAAEADVHIHFASTTPQGGANEGVLGFTTPDNNVYFVTSGWNYYSGQAGSGIGAGQYDFGTLAIHELAHTVGLGESVDPNSVMYMYLSEGTVRRTFTESNLSLINSLSDRFMKAAGFEEQASGVAAPVSRRLTPQIGWQFNLAAMTHGLGAYDARGPATPLPSEMAAEFRFRLSQDDVNTRTFNVGNRDTAFGVGVGRIEDNAVLIDNDRHLLAGGAGVDWFFANLNGGGTLDEVSDLRANELWTDTNF